MPTDLCQFWSYRDELAVADGIIFKGQQVLIPRLLRLDILAQLNSGHQGIEKTRHLARESVYWPRIDKDIEDLCKRCQFCQELQTQQPREPMKMHEKPGCPWVKLGTDLFKIGWRNFLIISDYFSRYPIIKEQKSITSAAVVTLTMEILSMFGVPREIVSDNGLQYHGIYNQFCAEWGIQHTTTSPWYSQSNGFIERQIRYLKPIIKKCLKSDGNIDLALLNVRATPLGTTLPGPAELMFSRPISNVLPSHCNQMAVEDYRDHMNALQGQQKAYGDQHTKELQPMLAEQQVHVLDHEKKLWFKGRVISRSDDQSYLIKTEGGRLIHRN